MIKIALVGAGKMGSRHARLCASLPGCSLAMVADANLKAAAILAEEYSVPASDDIDAVLSSPGIDAIVITVPTPFHKELTLKAAAAGKHIFCEKPIARNVEDGLEMVRACRDAGVVFMVGHVLRFFPQYAEASRLVRSGAVGKVGMIRSSRGGFLPLSRDSWYADINMSGGVMLDLIIHDFDWLLWSLGKAVRVYARGMIERGEYALVTIRFASGAIAHVEGTWIRPGGFKTSLEIAGDKGLISFSNDDSASLKTFLVPSDGQERSSLSDSPMADEDDPYRLEMSHFLQAVAGVERPSVTGEEAVEALKIALAALESIKTGRPVDLEG